MLTIYRPLDTLITFETAGTSSSAHTPVRYAVRQVLDQEYQNSIVVREIAARQARYKAGNSQDDVEFSIIKNESRIHHADETLAPKKDFFGRVVREVLPLQEVDGNAGSEPRGKKGKKDGKDENKVWISFHEGFSNAVRKPITIEELLNGL